MSRYEYKMLERLAVICSEDLILRLNKEGEEGWQVVTAKIAYEDVDFEFWEILLKRVREWC